VIERRREAYASLRFADFQRYDRKRGSIAMAAAKMKEVSYGFRKRLSMDILSNL